MFERILVPLDGSAGAETVIPTVALVAKRTAAEVMPLRVYHTVIHPRCDNVATTLELRQEAEQYIARMEDHFAADGIEARGLVRFGDAAETILKCVEEERASMIALSTHGRTGISRWVFGSVAEKVLRASPRPVLVVRSFEAASAVPFAKPFGNILLATDGSECARGIVPSVASLAEKFGSRIVVLSVIEGDVEKEVAAESVQSITAQLASEGVEGVVALRQGDPASQILEACHTYDIDLLAMSTHGRSGPSRWIFGSVTEKILRAARIPMLVVRGVASDIRGESRHLAVRKG